MLKSKSYSIILPVSVGNKLEELSKRRDLPIEDFIRVALVNIVKQGKYYELGDELRFGKYQGEQIETIIKADPLYILWCTKNIEGFMLSDKAEGILIELIHKEGIDV